MKLFPPLKTRFEEGKENFIVSRGRRNIHLRNHIGKLFSKIRMNGKPGDF